MKCVRTFAREDVGQCGTLAAMLPLLLLLAGLGLPHGSHGAADVLLFRALP